MGRWRPPAKAASPYITVEGAARLRAELDHLWRRERPEVVTALAAAAAEGDRSENAEYTYRKKQLGGIDRRIRYLSKRLGVLKVVSAAPGDRGRIRFGAKVWLMDETKGEHVIRIVGADETDAKSGAISLDAPLSQALLGKAKDDAVDVRTPTGVKHYQIIKIEY